MAWIYDTYAMMHPGRNNLPVVTGKPLDMGGSLGRNEATARGCLFVTPARARAGRGAGPDVDSTGARVAIQGFGNAGCDRGAAVHRGRGARSIAVSDSTGGVFRDDGLDLGRRARAQEADGLGRRPRRARRTITNDELLHLDCDVLIPAALENQIRADNVDGVQGEADRRGGERPDHAGGRPHRCSSAASRCCRTSWPTPAA